MGIVRKHPPVLLFVAAFAPSTELVDLGRQRLEARFGPIRHQSEFFRFDKFTQYYDGEMGPILYKQLLTFVEPIDPALLPEIKLQTNHWEEEVAAIDHSVPRPLNLDPGYLDPGKLILASTKDHAHRIYLNSGIFAETTLMFRQKKWTLLPWTYPDYQTEEYHQFLSESRNELLAIRSEKCS